MTAINPNLARVAAAPIMEVMGWVRETAFPANRPLINLSQAAPAGAPPEPLRRALADAVLNDTAAHLYGPVLGNDALRESIASRWSRDYGASIATSEVAITTGCNQAYCVAVATACAPGDQVLLATPWYFNHKMWLDMAGVGCIPLPCDANMLPDLDAARTLMSENVKAIALVSPNNPTGREYPDDLLNAFFDLARAHGAILILDETYRDFRAAEGPAHTLFRRDGWAETLVHLYSFSKVFRLTGHRTGAMITGAARLAEAEKFLDTMTISPPQTGQIAALYGLEHLEDWVAGERAEVLRRQAVLTEGFREHLPDWCLLGTGAYFAWAEPPFGLPATAMARRLIAECSVLVLPGSMFLPEGTETSALRIAFANSDADGISETVARLAAFRP